MNLPTDHLPEGWILTHLIFLDPGWQVNLRNEHHVVVATGETPEAVVIAGIHKIEREEYCGTLFRFVRNLVERPLDDRRGLLEALGLAKPLVIQRRKGL